MFPHLGMHGRRIYHRTPGGQQDGGQQVSGHPGGGPSHQVSRCGCDEDQVSRLAQPDMRHLGDACPRVGGYRLTGQGGPGSLADEPQRVMSRHDPDMMPGLGEQPEQLTGFIGRDARADAQDDTRRHELGSPAQPSMASTLSSRSLTSRSEMDSGFS